LIQGHKEIKRRVFSQRISDRVMFAFGASHGIVNDKLKETSKIEEFEKMFYIFSPLVGVSLEKAMAKVSGETVATLANIAVYGFSIVFRDLDKARHFRILSSTGIGTFTKNFEPGMTVQSNIVHKKLNDVVNDLADLFDNVFDVLTVTPSANEEQEDHGRETDGIVVFSDEVAVAVLEELYNHKNIRGYPSKFLWWPVGNPWNIPLPQRVRNAVLTKLGQSDQNVYCWIDGKSKQCVLRTLLANPLYKPASLQALSTIAETTTLTAEVINKSHRSDD
jgi:hypothetical protein